MVMFKAKLIITLVLYVAGSQSAVEFTVEELHGTGGNASTFPYFDFNVPRNVTTAVGQTAFLHCRVEQLGDKAVSKYQSFYDVLCD
jgi:hypothetical protein